jgi:hypothetical protein
VIHRTVSLASAAVLGAFLWGCALPVKAVPERIPVRWIVVEKRVGEIVPEGRMGDGQVDPQAVVLTMQPLYREDLEWEVVVDPHDYFVEVLEISPSRQASPGETVSATVRVGKAKASDSYRLVARPSNADVVIQGEAEHTVRGSSPATFRFTSRAGGRAGIAVGVEKMKEVLP